MSTVTTELSEIPTVTRTRWRIDPARSSIEFRTPTLWGLATVKGRFDRYEGTLDLDHDPAIELTIDAGSLDTKNRLRDKHLRSEDFFDVEHSPEVRFVADSATIDRQRLKVRGRLYAAGGSMPLELEAAVRPVGDELEVVASTHVDHRELGMTHSTLGMIRTPSELIVRGRLVRDG
jgi:polyisoprenoid-binding protein YceI